MVRFLKLKVNSASPFTSLSSDQRELVTNPQHTLGMNHVSYEDIRKLLENPNNKRQEQKKTLIAMTRKEQLGFKLERRPDYDLPRPVVANNFYRGHSQISKKILKRKHKGPLYNEAGRLCIELTEKYIQLEDFRMTTKISDMRHCLCVAQNEKINHKRRVDERLSQKNRSQNSNNRHEHTHPIHHSFQAIR